MSSLIHYSIWAIASLMFAITFTAVATAIRSSTKTGEVIQLGLAALGLMLAVAILPWQLVSPANTPADKDMRTAGQVLTLGFILIALAYLGFLSYYFPHADEIRVRNEVRKRNKSKQPNDRGEIEPKVKLNPLQVIGFAVSWLFFYPSGYAWCVGVGWITARLVGDICRALGS